MTRCAIDTIGANWQAAVKAAAAGLSYGGIKVTMIMTYADGPISVWPAEAITAAQATGLQVVRITVTGELLAGHAGRIQIGDEEPGDMNPASAAAWAKAERNAGLPFPVIYCDRSDKPAVITECQALSLRPGREFGLGVATLDGTFLDLDGSDLRHQPGVVGVQHLPSSRAGGPWDAWQITDDNWLPVQLPWQARALAEAQALTALLEAHQPV